MAEMLPGLEALLTVLRDNLKRCREQQGLSQQALAERCGMSTTFLAEIEIMRRTPSMETLVKLAEGLGVAPYELLAPQGNRDQAALESFARDLERGFSDLVKKGLRAN